MATHSRAREDGVKEDIGHSKGMAIAGIRHQLKRPINGMGMEVVPLFMEVPRATVSRSDGGKVL